MAMHTAQRPPQEMCNEANGFLQEIVPIVNNGNQSPAFTLNMDQTPINHAMNPKDTINRRGTRTINLRTAGGDSRQVTGAVTITASGHQLPSLVVFKGKSIHLDTANTVTNIMVDCCILIAGMPNGTIACREVPTLPAGTIYCLNEKAWFNEQIIHDWIEHVLAPYIATAPPGIIPILFLDQFRVHKMGSIVNAIQALDGRITRHIRWPIGGIMPLPVNGPIAGGSHLPGDNRPSCWQHSNASLVTMIYSCCPCCRGRRCASHDGIVDWAPGLARKAVAARSILIGVGTCATLPSNELVRRGHRFTGVFLGKVACWL
jgi:hypothetical protein